MGSTPLPSVVQRSSLETVILPAGRPLSALRGDGIDLVYTAYALDAIQAANGLENAALLAARTIASIVVALVAGVPHQVPAAQASWT